MKIRTAFNPVISITAIMFLALCGILLTHCKKFEVSREVIVKTEGISEITLHSCRAAGSLIDVGSTGVSQHGFCWSLTPNPAQAIDCKPLGSKNKEGGYSDIIEGFEPGTQYHIWAFAENEDGRKYGEPVIFATLFADLPTVETSGIIDVTTTSAQSESNVLSDGGAPVTDRGVCWNTEPSPTLDHAHTFDGEGTGPYISTIDGLTPGQEYYLRAYAINIAGVAYGNEHTLRTLPEFGELVDNRDGRVYQTVQIGEQVWMAQNLDIGEINAISFPLSDNELIEKYCYGDDPANCEVYGGLYTWNEMMQYNHDDPHGVCPAGWHIPSDEEWRILEMTVGLTEEETHGEEWRGGNAGGKLKAPGNEFWNDPNVGATDELGFHALPAGLVNEFDEFVGLRTFTGYWTSSLAEFDPWFRGLAWDNAGILRSVGNPEVGFSVRCVKD